MKKRLSTIILISTVAAIVLCSCGNNAPKELTISEILHNFNWLGDDGNYKNKFENKPFLQKNADGNNAAAGILDIDRDGELEFLITVYHVPRGIPSVEVFTIRNNRLQSLGGFFESHEPPKKLSYYKDKQGRLLFLQETQSHYGGITATLVATYTDDLKNLPIAGYQRDYGSNSLPYHYYVFPDNMVEECTNSDLCTAFSDSSNDYSATEEAYNLRIENFMSTLIWVEDVEYSYSVYYHLYNGHELPAEIRGQEIAEGLKMSQPKDFHTPEEVKRTSAMVADTLSRVYANYLP